MGVKPERFKQRRRKSPVNTALKITAAAFLLSLTVWFVFSSGAFSLFGLFDRVFFGSETVTGYTGEVNVNIFTVNYAGEFEINEAAEKLIFDYFGLYYGSLGELGLSGTHKNRLEKLYSPRSKAVTEDIDFLLFLIQEREIPDFLLSYSRCDVGIRYISAVIADDTLEIVLEESFAAVFRGSAESGLVSSEAAVRHFFDLKQNRDAWLITKHTVTRPESTENNHFTYEIPDGESLAVSEPDYEYPYDRNTAAQYALLWTDIDRAFRNLEYIEFTDNSVNFTSQCLFAGGILMDAQGLYLWKYYGAFRDNTNEREGFSNSWVENPAFTDYIYGNAGESFGVVTGFVLPKMAEKGDIVQFTDDENNVVYQALITFVQGEELFLTGNSREIRNFPASALGYGKARVLKIYGYNT